MSRHTNNTATVTTTTATTTLSTKRKRLNDGSSSTTSSTKGSLIALRLEAIEEKESFRAECLNLKDQLQSERISHAACRGSLLSAETKCSVLQSKIGELERLRQTSRDQVKVLLQELKMRQTEAQEQVKEHQEAKEKAEEEAKKLREELKALRADTQQVGAAKCIQFPMPFFLWFFLWWW